MYEEERLPLQGKAVFVTGAGGFIGSAVVRELVLRGTTVRALAGAPGQQTQALPASDASVAIHLAGPPSVTASFQDPSRRRPAGADIDELVADRTYAATVLGWRPAMPLEGGLQRTLNWMRGQS